MDKKTLRKELEGKMEDMPWTYRFVKEGGTVNFTNVRTGSMDEKKFLERLREEGAEEIIEGSDDIHYRIARSNEKLWLSLIDENMKDAGDANEITEQNALAVFREAKNERESPGGLFSIFMGKSEEPRKEMVPNHLKIKYKLIESIDMESERRNKLVKIIGKGFKIGLREDGGVAFESSK